MSESNKEEQMMGATSKNQFVALFEDGFSSPLLTDWLRWAADQDPQHIVALPMIQRGSVWKPRQMITLWDSLLRGMPIGSLMVTRLHEQDKHGKPVQVRKLGSGQLEKVPPGGGVALLDGQQRTLAMLLGWAGGPDQGRVLWVDFADKPGSETLFRMHMTSQAHPYGYSKSDPNAKLALSARREAREKIGPGKQFPWESNFPIPLNRLIQIFIEVEHDVARWKSKVNEALHAAEPHRDKKWGDYVSSTTDAKTTNNTAQWDAMQALDRFSLALEALFKLKIPLIAIPDHCFSETVAQEDENPALAILFKRVATGGTDLTDADYAYSVIKHHLPETFELVESLANQKGFAEWLGSLDIVMTAVRLAAFEQKWPDYESPNKANFDTLRKNGDFLSQFLKLVKFGRLEAALRALTDGLKYQPENGVEDAGLPLYAFRLVPRPVLQILLCWLLQSTQEADRFAARVKESRAEMLRFVLYAHFGFIDVRLASTWAFAWLRDNSAQDGQKTCFPGQALVTHLIQRSINDRRDVARMLPSVDAIKKLAITPPESSERPMRGWERFDKTSITDEKQRNDVTIFHRWWGNENRYQHPILLWLQRDYVQRLSIDPKAVHAEDELPYDYDHICPAKDWRDWRGIQTKDRLIDFLSNNSNRGHTYVGNAIGNVRVWSAVANRHDGATPAMQKLGLDRQDASSATILKESAIHADEDWKACSNLGNETSWNAERARAFQKVVETRTLNLYARYFKDLGFDKWFPITATSVD